MGFNILAALLVAIIGGAFIGFFIGKMYLKDYEKYFPNIYTESMDNSNSKIGGNIDYSKPL